MNRYQAFGVILITIIFTTLFFKAYVESVEDSRERLDHVHWVYDYKFRGRVQHDVLCKKDKLIDDRGEHVNLPDHLKVPSIKKDINRNYEALEYKLSLLKKR